MHPVTISVTPSGKYYASIGLNLDDQEIKQSTDGVVTGIDLGLKDYVTCHNGTNSYSVKHPKWLKRHQRNLRYQQKQLSRRKKASNRRAKARKLVVRVHERLSNTRQDFLHKLSRKITALSQVVVVENLNIRGMVKNHPPAFGTPLIKGGRGDRQSGWGMFLNFLNYKPYAQRRCLCDSLKSESSRK
ncbi:MAG: RNA-guided endonuclease TnpB family protein [Xenococcaceae cyanobacterium MO_207.B15]|nr:RNA-guided endonuclease TnpB family protein [Xenococcaceae cyanobacterium MO_207.B15]